MGVLKEFWVEFAASGVWLVASAIATWLRSLDSVYMFLILFLAGGIAIGLISFFLRKGFGLREHRQLKKLEEETLRLRNEIAEYNADERRRRIDFRKPLLELPDLLSQVEKCLGELVDEISSESTTEQEEYKELSYYTSRLKSRSERYKDLPTIKGNINTIFYKVGDTELSGLLDTFNKQLNDMMSDRCYNYYLQKHKPLSFEETYNISKADEIKNSILNDSRARLGKRLEDLCMGVESK